MERLYKKFIDLIRKIKEVSTPYFRRLIRFFGLPYCYFFQVNWQECTASRFQVITDFLYVFFILKFYPDNYSVCHFYEKDRDEWHYYYGSSYDPFQRFRLRKRIQRPEYQILFEDKEICDRLCHESGIPTPRYYGFIDKEDDFKASLKDILNKYSIDAAIVKPAAGSAGRGIALVEKRNSNLILKVQSEFVDWGDWSIDEKYLVQEYLRQHPSLADFSVNSLNTIRLLTLYCSSGEVLPLAAFMRFGVAGSLVDNWSAGGVAVGVDIASGTLHEHAFEKSSRRHEVHPSSGLRFGGFVIPEWREIIELGVRTQKSFPFYRMLGLDIALTDRGPVIVEVNADPDTVAQEQTSGPLLASERVWQEFKAYDLLINKPQMKLFDVAGLKS